MVLVTPDILVAGETLVDFLPERVGSLESVESFRRRPGGAPANVAVGLAALDRTPWFWTRIGDDPFGDSLAATLADAGLPNRFVERDPEAKTTLAFVEHDATADRAFTFYRDGTADTRLQPGTVPDDVLESVEWVYVGGVTLASEPARTATLNLAERASDQGSTVVFDPNARPELWGDEFPAVVERMLDHADVVKATPEDLVAAGFDADVGPEALASAVHDAGRGYRVDPTDTTGAGDAFTAGALAALADGEPLDEGVAFANAVAAVTTTATGAMAALPDRTAVRAFREEQ
ncbi:carbohydrate kinase [Halobacteriales archaeon QS_9_67_17]|nr:MAG: carbohydrate kinase [Halobacteriales archaeon QS_9_67_17]